MNRSAEQISGSAAINLTNTVVVGPEGNAVFTNYEDTVLSDSTTYSAGGFIEAQLTGNIRVRLAGGYQWIDFDRNFETVDFGFPFGVVMIPDKKDLADYYANGLLTHQINASISQSISAGRETQLGVNSNYIKLNYVRHTMTWKVVRNTLLTTEFFYEDAKDSGGFAGIQFGPGGIVPGSAKGEHLHRYGGALALGYQLTPHVTLGLRYQYTQKDSDVAFRDYTQNRISLDGTYSF